MKRAALVAPAVVCMVAAAGAQPAQPAFTYQGFGMPVVREHRYVVNARVRPLLLFWIGRDDVGEARMTWRKGAGGRRAFDLLIGSDPARAPRRINRWGFIVEELGEGQSEVLGLMRESHEQTIEEAEAEIARQDGTSAFKVVQTTIDGTRAVSGTRTVLAPAGLTFRDLDALLALLPTAPARVRTVEVPSGIEHGFLAALDGLINASVGTCGAARGRATSIAAVPYLYNQTLYDLSLTSCEHEAEAQANGHTFDDVVDGRFQIRNRTTKNKTEFRVLYGESGALRAVPVRAVFRPRWWMEVELVLDPRKGPA